VRNYGIGLTQVELLLEPPRRFIRQHPLAEELIYSLLLSGHQEQLDFVGKRYWVLMTLFRFGCVVEMSKAVPMLSARNRRMTV
jgi:hypothetical protein